MLTEFQDGVLDPEEAPDWISILAPTALECFMFIN